MNERCYLVYALAPEGVNAGRANELFNEYIGDLERGLVDVGRVGEDDVGEGLRVVGVVVALDPGGLGG
jgi:hypothetical protein